MNLPNHCQLTMPDPKLKDGDMKGTKMIPTITTKTCKNKRRRPFEELDFSNVFGNLSLSDESVNSRRTSKRSKKEFAGSFCQGDEDDCKTKKGISGERYYNSIVIGRRSGDSELSRGKFVVALVKKSSLISRKRKRRSSSPSPKTSSLLIQSCGTSESTCKDNFNILDFNPEGNSIFPILHFKMKDLLNHTLLEFLTIPDVMSLVRVSWGFRSLRYSWKMHNKNISSTSSNSSSFCSSHKFKPRNSQDGDHCSVGNCSFTAAIERTPTARMENDGENVEDRINVGLATTRRNPSEHTYTGSNLCNVNIQVVNMMEEDVDCENLHQKSESTSRRRTDALPSPLSLSKCQRGKREAKTETKMAGLLLGGHQCNGYNFDRQERRKCGISTDDSSSRMSNMKTTRPYSDISVQDGNNNDRTSIELQAGLFAFSPLFLRPPRYVA